MRTITLGLAMTALLATSSAFPAQAQDGYEGLAAAIRDAKQATAFPSGTAVIVLKDGGIAYEGYFGYADIAAKTPVDRDTVFYLASATKPFFALNALLAEHEGVIDSGTRLRAMFPDLHFTGVDASKPTLRDLLVHTSGIENVALGWATAFSGLHDAGSRHRLVASSTANVEAPHGSFDYTNVGYNIASVWLDGVEPAPWQERLRARVFAPLGMHRTTARASEADARGWTLAKPYSYASAERDQPLYLRKTDATMHAAGGMLSTARDVARFLSTQLADGGLDGRQRLPATVIRAAREVQATTDGRYLDFARDGYAWGWYAGDYKGRRMLHHFGGFAGFHAHLSFMPEAGIGLVVLNNEDMLGARLTNLVADYAYGLALGEDGVEAAARQRFAGLATDAAKLDLALTKQREAIGTRAWRLSLPRSAYAGRYRHPDLGEMRVVLLDDEGLLVQWGALRARASGYDQPDHLRVELVPNSGDVLAFTVAGGRVEAIALDGLRFERLD